MDDTEADEVVRTLAYAIRKRWEDEKMRLAAAAALAGGAGVALLPNVFGGRVAAAAVDLIVLVAAGALFEWRWSVAMRVPGSDKEDPHG